LLYKKKKKKKKKGFKIKQIDIIVAFQNPNLTKEVYMKAHEGHPYYNKNFFRLYMDLSQAAEELNNESNNLYINLGFKQLVKRYI